MFNLRPYTSAIFIGIFLAGCAAMGVPETTDPDKKVRYAYMLFDQQQRPLPAERLIREAIAIYQERNNELGLAEAYRAYGFFFRSGAVEKWQKHYESNAFMETGTTYVNRYDKSIEYFDKSAAILEKHKKYDALTNVYLNIGFTYELTKQPEKACAQYNKSVISNQEHMKNTPGASLTLPQGFASYDAYVTSVKEKIKCAN